MQRENSELFEAMPRQAEHQGVKLLLGQRHRCARQRPEKRALMQLPCAQPQTETVMDQRLQPATTMSA